RLLGPGPAWRDQEEARVAHAAVVALGRCAEHEAVAWLDPVTVALDTTEQAGAEQGAARRPPAWMHNAYTTCASVYVALSEQPRDGEADADVDHADAVCAGLAHVMSRMTPWLVMPRRRPPRDGADAPPR
ncbi:MAG: hypothetical protein ACTMHL_11625, partial [Janibacter sp.]